MTHAHAAYASRIGGVRAPHGAWAGTSFRGVQVLRLTPDVKKLITGHADTTALVWPVPPRVK